MGLDAEGDGRVLMVYWDVNLYQAEAVHDARAQAIYSVSADDKASVQTLATTYPDLPLGLGQARWYRARPRIRSPRHAIDSGRARSAYH